jgi:hypothetical protein
MATISYHWKITLICSLLLLKYFKCGIAVTTVYQHIIVTAYNGTAGQRPPENRLIFFDIYKTVSMILECKIHA